MSAFTRLDSIPSRRELQAGPQDVLPPPFEDHQRVASILDETLLCSYKSENTNVLVYHWDDRAQQVSAKWIMFSRSPHGDLQENLSGLENTGGYGPVTNSVEAGEEVVIQWTTGLLEGKLAFESRLDVSGVWSTFAIPEGERPVQVYGTYMLNTYLPLTRVAVGVKNFCLLDRDGSFHLSRSAFQLDRSVLAGILR